MIMPRFVTVFFGFCITQILATLKQPFRRSLLSRINDLPRLDINFNLLADLSASLKFPFDMLPSTSLISDWMTAFRVPSNDKSASLASSAGGISDRAVGPPLEKRSKLSGPVAPANGQTSTRCVNSEVIIAIEAVLLCLTPLVLGLEEIASPVAALELIFFLVVSVGAKAKLDVPYEQFERAADRNWSGIWNDVLSTVEDPKSWLASYFVGAKFEDLRKEDVLGFLTWAMFTTTPEHLNKRDEYVVLRSLKQLEAFMVHEFKPRDDQSIDYKILRPSIENLRWVHKPLLFYLVTQGVFGALLSHRMAKNNFVRKSSGEITYWTNVDSVKSDKVPIVMCHGIGGLCAYFDFVKALLPLDCPLIVLEIPSVSLHIAPNVPSIDAHVSATRDILDKHGFDKAVFIGHSFGSSIVSWVVQNMPERVAGSVFMDPVVFMLHLTDTLNNWTYEPVANKVNLEGLLDIVKTGYAALL